MLPLLGTRWTSESRKSSWGVEVLLYDLTKRRWLLFYSYVALCSFEACNIFLKLHFCTCRLKKFWLISRVVRNHFSRSISHSTQKIFVQYSMYICKSICTVQLSKQLFSPCLLSFILFFVFSDCTAVFVVVFVWGIRIVALRAQIYCSLR